MKRILAASLSLIGLTSSIVNVQPGQCQGGAIQANTTKVNNALPGGKRPTNSNSNVGGVNANIGGVNTNIGGVNANGPKLNSPGSQSQLNPGRVGDQLGGIQDTLNTGVSGLNQSITEGIGVSKIVPKQPSGGSGTGNGGSQGSGSVDNRPLQDKLTDVGQQQAADALGQDPNGNFAGTGTPGPGTTGGNTAGGSAETGSTGGGDSSGNSASSGGDSGRGNRNTGESSGDTGHTTETGHGSRSGGDSIFEHPTTGQAGAVSAPSSNIHIEQENVGNVNANIGDNLQNGAGALRNGSVEGLGSQLNGVEVRSLKGGGGGRPGGARNVTPNLNNRLPGAGTAGASGVGGINANVGVGTPNVGVGTGAKLDIGRGALGNQNVGNINSQLNQIKDVAAGAISDGRPSDRGVGGGGGPVGGQVPPVQGQGGSVPGNNSAGPLQNGEGGTGNPNIPGIFDTGKGFGGADGVTDFVPDANNSNTNGGDSGSFGNPNNAGGTGATGGGGGSTQGDPRTPAGIGDHSTTGHTEGGSDSSSGSGGGGSETGHTTGTHSSGDGSGGQRQRGGDDGIFEHPTTGQAGAVSVPGANIHIDQENVGNVNANVGGNLQNRAGALRNGAVEGLGSQLNGVEVRSFKSDGGGASAAPGARSGFGGGASPFAPGGKFSGVAAPVSLPGAGANTGVVGGTGIVSPRNLPGVGGKVGGATLPGAAGRAPLGNVSGVGGTTLNVPKINPNSAIYIKMTDIAPRSLNTGAGAVRPNLPNFSGGAGSIKITPNLNLNAGGATPSRGGSVVSPTQRTQQNITRPTLVAPTRR